MQVATPPAHLNVNDLGHFHALDLSLGKRRRGMERGLTDIWRGILKPCVQLSPRRGWRECGRTRWWLHLSTVRDGRRDRRVGARVVSAVVDPE